jgi:hypothetical protein
VKNCRVFFIVALLLFTSTSPLEIQAQDYASEGDLLHSQGGLHNYKKAVELYHKALQSSKADYSLYWKFARLCHDYGEEAEDRKIQGWKKICIEYGRLGMEYAQKAIDLDGRRPEGYYYYGLNIGVYAEGAGALAALKEGLKKKTRYCFEKAYEIDKMYDKGGPILALARFWAVLPWPFKDKTKALKYYREYEQTPYFQEKSDAQVYFAELLLSFGGKENREEARKFLKMAAKSRNREFSLRADKLLREIENREARSLAPVAPSTQRGGGIKPKAN